MFPDYVHGTQAKSIHSTVQPCSARLAHMDERTIKRLLIMVAASIIAIMLLKMGLTKTYITLNKAAAKKLAAAAKPSETQPTSPAASETVETPAALAVV